MHEPRPDGHVPASEKPWRVHCEWVTPGNPGPTSPPGPRESGWAWAVDGSGRRILIEEHLENGFFDVEKAWASSGRDDRGVVALAPTSEALSKACLRTVRGLDASERRELVSVRAAREGEDVDVALVFPHDPATPRPVSRMVLFGDSLSCTGNLKKRLLVFPNSPYWLGRFSNGPNWADYFAKSTGVSIQNHAYGGAAATTHDDVPPDQVLAKLETGMQHFLTGSLANQVKEHVELDSSSAASAAPRPGDRGRRVTALPRRARLRPGRPAPRGSPGRRSRSPAA